MSIEFQFQKYSKFLKEKIKNIENFKVLINWNKILISNFSKTVTILKKKKNKLSNFRKLKAKEIE